MKRLSLYIFLVLMVCNVSYSQSMMSLKNYIEDNKGYLGDPITYAYILKRCASVYLYAGAITKDANKQTSDEFLNLYRNISFSVTKMLTEQMNWTAEVAGKNVLTDMENMGKYYEIDGNDSFARTGKYMENNYIGEDLRVCKAIVEGLNK